MSGITVDFGKDGFPVTSGVLHVELNRPAMFRATGGGKEDGNSPDINFDRYSVGDKIEVKSQGGVLFSGHVESLTARYVAGGDQSLSIVAYDQLFALMTKQVSKNYGAHKLKEVLEDLTGLEVSVGEGKSRGVPEEILKLPFGGDTGAPTFLRNNQNALEALRYLCGRYGINFWHADGKLRLDDFLSKHFEDRDFTTAKIEEKRQLKSYEATASIKSVISDCNVVFNSLSDGKKSVVSEYADGKSGVSARKRLEESDLKSVTLIKTGDAGLNIDHAKRIAFGEVAQRSLEYVTMRVDIGYVAATTGEDGDKECDPLSYRVGETVEVDLAENKESGPTRNLDGRYVISAAEYRFQKSNDAATCPSATLTLKRDSLAS